ncbi:MAG: methionyl-tRNA formyltransferase, partial [Bacteroidota bacterium]
KMTASAVKNCAVKYGLRILQPANLKSIEFQKELASLNADLFVVVAFRMLPETVWSMARLGTFNLHGSLLPDYRGAAPINWAVMNGETYTGVTTFLLRHEIDTGAIILQEKIAIGSNEKAGSVHDRMMIIGAELVVKTADAFEIGDVKVIEQDELLKGRLAKSAPKLNRINMRINWTAASKKIHDHVRGLSPYPAAYTELVDYSTGIRVECKILSTAIVDRKTESGPGTIMTDQKSYLYVNTADSMISVQELQLAGKQRMQIKQFLNGFKIIDDMRFE